MNYPNKRNTYQKSQISASNRGMSLEEDINKTNEFYLLEDRGNIHKKPTPITIVKVDYPKRSAAKITEAYFKLPSTTDYNGIYKGKYIDFEAKECNSRTSFPFGSIHEHQVTHLESVMRHGAVAFLIIRMTQYGIDYLIRADEFASFYRGGTRKSITYAWIREHGHEIPMTYQKPCDYLRVVDEVFGL